MTTQQTEEGTSRAISSPLDELGEYARGVYLAMEQDIGPVEGSKLLAKLFDLQNRHLGNLENAAIDIVAEQFRKSIDPYARHPGSD